MVYIKIKTSFLFLRQHQPPPLSPTQSSKPYMELWFSTDLLISFMKISRTVLKLKELAGFPLKITNGHNLIKMYTELQNLSSAHGLMILYICTKFYDNILNCFKVIQLKQY